MSTLADQRSSFSRPGPRPGAPAQGGAAPPSILSVATQLEALLLGMIGEHEALLQITADHRQALAAADRAAIDASVNEQREAAARLSRLDGQRNAIMRSATAALRGVIPPGVQPTATVIAGACPEPLRSRLIALTARARDVAMEVSARQSAVRSAAETLMAHMQGLIAQVSRAMSPTGTYAHPAAAGMGSAQVSSSLDLTS